MQGYNFNTNSKIWWWECRVVSQLINYLRHLKTDILENTNITSRQIGIKVLRKIEFLNLSILWSFIKTDHPLRVIIHQSSDHSSSSDVMHKIAAHTSSLEGTSNNSRTRNLRKPVSITTVTTKDHLTNLNRIVINSCTQSFISCFR